MKTREQIITEILLQHKLDHEKTYKTDHYKTLTDERGQAFIDELLAERDAYSAIIKAELQKRLTEESYLACEDFDHFDVTCCEPCHTCYPHYDMHAVLLSDDRSAWVCHSIRAILMRKTKAFARRPDPIGDTLHEACMAASSDKEKLYYCLKYAHHKYGRRRGHETVESLVTLALSLPRRGPAQSSTAA